MFWAGKREGAMKGKVLGSCLGLVVVSVIFLAEVRAEWSSVSAGIPEADIHWVTVDLKKPEVLYAVSEKYVYKTPDNGASWSQIFAIGGLHHKIQSIYVDPSVPGRVYSAGTSGVWRSENSGNQWDFFYQGVGGETKNVLCLAGDPANAGRIWLGTAEGLVTVNVHSKKAEKVAGFPNVAVQSILISDLKTRSILVSAADGIYQSVGDGARWKKVLTNSGGVIQADDASLQQAGIEEIPSMPLPANLIFHAPSDKFFVPTPRGIYEADSKDPSWRPAQGKDVFNGRINYLAASSRFFYLASNRGVYRWDLSSLIFSNLSGGLPSLEVHMVFYDSRSDRLLAATGKGIFQFLRPESTGPGTDSPENKAPSVTDILKSFEQEPTIQEIQKAAIEYAEVHPRKIQEWRAAASKRAWLPDISVNQKIGLNQNIDLDRGGTGDADRFIQGPDEKAADWTVSASWDLGELVWNDDQTSIDTRSKLMAELRDDVLNEVTHFYYERRRLQVEMAIRPSPDLSGQIKKRLLLDELTANIDGLTGGYMSKRLQELPLAMTKSGMG